jgi:hypothetical protein
MSAMEEQLAAVMAMAQQMMEELLEVRAELDRVKTALDEPNEPQYVVEDHAEFFRCHAFDAANPLRVSVNDGPITLGDVTALWSAGPTDMVMYAAFPAAVPTELKPGPAEASRTVYVVLHVPCQTNPDLPCWDAAQPAAQLVWPWVGIHDTPLASDTEGRIVLAKVQSNALGYIESITQWWTGGAVHVPEWFFGDPSGASCAHKRRAGWKQPSVIAGVHNHGFANDYLTYAMVGDETNGYVLTASNAQSCKSTCYNCPDGLVSEAGVDCCPASRTYLLDDTGDVPIA